LLDDWGCWLDLTLYTEALLHFAVGEGYGVRLLPLARDAVSLGRQCFQLLSPETAFRLTALTEGTSDYEHQLRSLRRLSPLRTLQWVNLARQRVRFVSLTR